MSLATESPIEPVRPTRRRHLVAFEFEVEGHHPGYVENFAHCWVSRPIAGQLTFVVTPKFFDLHGDCIERITKMDPDRVRIQALTMAEYRRMERISYLRYFVGWELYCKYAADLQADHGLAMYFDFFQLPSVLGSRSPCPFSAIYFRPTFHYRQFQGYCYSTYEWYRAQRKALLLKRVLKLPQLSNLFCLDEVAAEYIVSHFKPSCHVRRMADSFLRHPRTESQKVSREDLGVLPGRVLFTLLGVLDQRKGVKELLEALRKVPDDKLKKMSLLLIGRVKENHRESIHQAVKDIQNDHPVQIVLCDQWIEEGSVQDYYEISDVVLATYQRHMGSSSALIRAALAGKPVLSSDYGLMGEIVRRRRLGVTVNTEDPEAVAAKIGEVIDSDLSSLLDLEEATRFAAEHSQEHLTDDLALMLQDGGNE